MSAFAHPVDDDDEWWANCALPPLHIDLTEDPPDAEDDDPGADAERHWSESELPPVVEFVDDEPPADVTDSRPPDTSARLVVGGRTLTQPAPGGDPVSLGTSWVAGLSPAKLVDSLVELQRARSWVDGLTHQALARVADLDPSEDQWCHEEVAAALRVAPITAGRRIADALALCLDLPRTLDCLLSGQITNSHAAAVGETVRLLPPELAARLENAVLGRAAGQTTGQLRRSLRRVALTLDPDHAERAHPAARNELGVAVRPGVDGMSRLIADLPAADAAAILPLLDSAADQQLIADRRAAHETAPHDMPSGGADDAGEAGLGVRSTDQIRADLLVDVLLAALDPDRCPRGTAAGL